MAELRDWWHAQMARLDGGRERKIVALGSMTLLIALSVGPTVIGALAQTVATYTQPAPTPTEPRTVVTIMDAPVQNATSVSEHVDAPATDIPATPPATLPIPPLAFLFPQNGAVTGGPITIAAHLESATAIAMIYEITSLSGETLQMLSASPTPTGEWSALMSAEPGEYVVKARASLSDGRVVAFNATRTFTLTETIHAPTPADPSEPVVELNASDADSAAWNEAVPLTARVKNMEPNTLVFIVTAPDDSETLVLGVEAASGGYWTGMFQGADGVYRVRARATVGGEEYFSNENIFTLKQSEG